MRRQRTRRRSTSRDGPTPTSCGSSTTRTTTGPRSSKASRARSVAAVASDGSSSGSWGARSGTGGPPGADAATHWSRRGGHPGAGTSTTSVASIADTLEDAARREWTYPEWDLHRHGYRPDWCTVSEVERTTAELAPFEPPDTHSLRRALAPLGREWQRRPRQLQGIDIDIDAAVTALVDVAAGSPPSEEVYIDILRQRRDLAVLILLDISGSAGEPSPSGGMVHEHQRRPRPRSSGPRTIWVIASRSYPSAPRDGPWSTWCR